MIKKKSYKFNIWDMKPDRTLRPKKGWINMELRWLVDENTMGSEFGTLGYTVFPPDSQHAPHIHENAEEYIMVTKGYGIASSGKNEYEVSAGDIVFIPKGDVHFTRNTSKKENLEIFFVYAGAPSLEKAGYKLETSK
jgi:quercetin dioxygenase-like cupin family protein